MLEAALRDAERPDHRTLRVLARLDAVANRYDTSVAKLAQKVQELENESQKEDGINSTEDEQESS